MKPWNVLLVLLLAGAAVAADEGQPLTLDTAPPVVVKSEPTAGSGDVDPKLGEIRVTFSKDMQDGSWSWAKVADSKFPAVTGPIRYLADKRTCVLPVKLEPGQTYAVWINTEQLKNFKDPADRPAVPYLIVFKTRR